MLQHFMDPFACLLRRFKRDNRGNVAVIFALATLPIIGFVGAAVDYSTANAAKATMQSALDSTALMLAKYAPTHTAAEIQDRASKYFKAVFDSPLASDVELSANYTSSNSTILVHGTAEVPTTFMTIMGINYVPISGSSTSTWGTTRLRVALVLDNTGSMAQDGKMTALKEATKSLLAQLRSAASNDGDVYVSIVPFSKDVNVGSANYNSDWIDWADWEDNNGSWQNTSSCSSGHGHSRRGRSQCNNNLTWVPANHNTWNGCITDRGNPTPPGTTAGYDQLVDAPDTSNPDTLFPAEQYSNCPVEMMGLNYNWTTMNSLVDSMQPAGNTNQPIGLVWGWQSLVGGGPLTSPPLDANYVYKKIIILLSDGLNTEDRWYNRQSSIDTRMLETGNGAGTCANIKAAGVTIYTIQVNTGGDPTSSLLENCASSQDRFYLLTQASDIAGAFDSIGTALTKLRLAK